MPHRQQTSTSTFTKAGEVRPPETDSHYARPRRHRRVLLQTLWVGLDMLVMATAAWLASDLLDRPLQHATWLVLMVGAGTRLFVFVRLGMYRAALRYSGLHVLAITVVGVLLGTVVAVFASWFGGGFELRTMGRAFFTIEALLAMIGCGGLRIIARIMLQPRAGDQGKRVLIYGAGDLGEATFRTLGRSGQFTPVAFLDDDAHKHGTTIHGCPVVGGIGELSATLHQRQVQRIFIAIHNLPDPVARVIARHGQAVGVPVTLVRGLDTVHGGLRLRDLQLEDLLPRPSRRLDPAPVRAMLAGTTVLITGAGGSIGAELCRQVCGQGVDTLVLLDHSEFNLYQIEADLRGSHPGVRLVPVLDNLQSPQRLATLLEAHRPTTIFHAAAYKHVPMVELNPFAGVLNNVGGFRNLLAAADAAGVPRLVLISTDKAVRPTNVMGATKRVCELLLQSRPMRATHGAAVRFGNVLGSSGSVVPVFLRQIEAGGPVTVTDPEITRYFMLIPEAVALVLASGAMADHGEIFILDMGQPVKIADLARQLIFLSGHSEEEIPLRFTGLRPGEKLYEELLLDESERGTPIAGITVGKPTRLEWAGLEARVDQLLAAARERDTPAFVATLTALVPEWVPSATCTALADRPAEKAEELA